jgi:hypothetical protein
MSKVPLERGSRVPPEIEVALEADAVTRETEDSLRSTQANMEGKSVGSDGAPTAS